MPPTSFNGSLPKLTQLLISVRNVREAEICWRLGVDWIDLKEPLAGSLGAPSLETAQAIAAFLYDFPKRSGKPWENWLHSTKHRPLPSARRFQLSKLACPSPPTGNVGSGNWMNWKAKFKPIWSLSPMQIGNCAKRRIQRPFWNGPVRIRAATC